MWYLAITLSTILAFADAVNNGLARVPQLGWVSIQFIRTENLLKTDARTIGML